MADLTSTIRVTCTLGGKVIAFTHTAVVADVYDIGFRQAQNASATPVETDSGATDGGGASPTFQQTSPDYLLVRNDGVSAAASVGILASDFTSLGLTLTPGAVMIAMAPTTGGIAKASGTATESTLNDGQNVQINSAYSGLPIASVLLAYNSAS